jgi:import receptor subunit TOM34
MPFYLISVDRESYASAVSGLFNNKAACYMKMGDCKQCVLECNESLKLVDSNLKALIRRGTAYEIMEK